jgi:hypothetical protein
MARPSALPPSCLPRGLSSEGAAAYFSISPSLFDQMVADGRMPKPKRFNTRNVWDRLALDAAFTAIPDDNPHDDVWGRVAV